MTNVLITGGAGFIGCNYAARLLTAGHRVTLLDNLSRKGAAANLRWLQAHARAGTDLRFIEADVRDADALRAAAGGQAAIFHLAAQVAVTTSVRDPRADFEVNALGSFNVLEAARHHGHKPLVLYASTNKVYGGMENVEVLEGDMRYAYAALPEGLPETQALDFHSPYGCSKGAGDQYTRDYARIYDLPTVVFRQSCIYGLRQFGVEDQGWLAHFVIAAAKHLPINIYGNGKQVRDMLWIDDLLDAYDCALAEPARVKGRVFNIGGGPRFTLSIWKDVEPLLTRLAGRALQVQYGDWRPGDQPIYVSDIRKAAQELQWAPKVAPQDGVEKLWKWVNANLALFD